MRKSKLLCILLAIVLIIGLSGSGFAITIGEATEATIGTDKDVPEEKNYREPTLQDKFADDRLLVILSNSASLRLKSYSTADFPEIQCESVKNLTPHTTANISALLSNTANTRDAISADEEAASFTSVDPEKFNQVLCVNIKNPGKQNVLDAIDVLKGRDDFVYVGPDYEYQLRMVTPNDPKLTQQWASNKILLPMAWETTTGSASVKIGIMSSGIYASHPEFNGRVSTTLSREFISGNIAQITPITDPIGAGTFCAGIVGAKGNNGIGIAGVTWNTTLVSLKIMNSNGISYSSYAVLALQYANSAQIPIVLLTGGWVYGEDNTYYDGALDNAISRYYGLVVCPAGDNYRNLDFNFDVYPAKFTNDNLLVVGASNSSDQRWHIYETNIDINLAHRGSNVSTSYVHLFAPGDGILSTFISTTNNSTLYFTDSGTTAAASYVAGVAALMLSECPNLTTAQLKDRIMSTCDTISAFEESCVTGGRLNASTAVSKAHTFPTSCYGNYNATVHYYTCSCGETKAERHKFTNIGVQYVCIPCGYMTTSP